MKTNFTTSVYFLPTTESVAVVRSFVIAVVCLGLLATAADAGVQSTGAVPASLAESLRLSQSARALLATDPTRARVIAEAAGRIADAGAGEPHERDLAIATSQWLRGEASLRLDDPAAAKTLLGQAFATVSRQDAGSAAEADILVSRARLESTTGEVQAALADDLAAFEIYKRIGSKRQQAATLQDIGLLYHDAGDYNRSLGYYAQSQATFSGDRTLDLSVDNNRADALKELGRAREAERDYTSALKIAQNMGSPSLEAQILSNLTVAQFSDHQYAAAEANVAKGLRLARSQAAGALLPILLSTRAQLDLREGNVGAALAAIDAIPEQAGDDLASERDSWVHRTKYEVYKAEGRSGEALRELEMFQKIDTGHRSLMSSANTALMAARFDFDNQNARIALLKTGELRRDMALTRLRALEWQLGLGALLAFVTALIIFLALYLRTLRRSHRQTQAINKQLGESNIKLEDALQAKTQFLATTSHEIRTPLNGVLGMTEVLLAGQDLSDGVRQRVALIHGAGESMRTLVDDLLDMSKMDAGQIVLQRDVVDFPKLMEEISTFWRPHAESAGLTLTLDIAGAPTMILEDSRRFRQILSNLLSNAVKFTPAGTVTVSAKPEAAEGGERLIVCVSDTGIDIADDLREFIFDKFTQVDTSVTRRYGGTGLGLSIARNLARAMGGDITVASNAAGGADFLVALPLMRVSTRDVVKPEFGRTTPSLVDLKVAIVEPSLITQGGLRALLERRVDSLSFIPTVREAIERIVACGLHVVIASFPRGGRIPGDPIDEEMTELAKACRRSGIDLVIILDPGDVVGVRTLNLAGASYLERPINAVNLVRHLESVHELNGPVPALRA